MDTTTQQSWRELTKRLLTELADIPYAVSTNLAKQTVFDERSDHYLVLVQGWDHGQRMHGCLVHIEIIEDKIWIQQDGTEYGMATEFLTAGIPKSQIVLGFKSPRRRELTGFAVG